MRVGFTPSRVESRILRSADRKNRVWPASDHDRKFRNWKKHGGNVVAGLSPKTTGHHARRIWLAVTR